MVVLVVMGVCGCGKTTVGRALAEKFDVPFQDADDYHPSLNIDKMSRGVPLTDQDRIPWLHMLHDQLVRWEFERNEGSITSGDGVKGDSVSGDGVRGVLACSALKQSYRNILLGVTCSRCSLIGQLLFVYLRGSHENIMERMHLRRDHFMPPSLLQSQFDALEEPTKHCVTVSTAEPVECVVEQVVSVVFQTPA